MNFTKILAGVISTTIICGSVTLTSNVPFSSISVKAAEEYKKETVGDFTFNVYSDHADLAAIKAGVDGDIIIPSTINEVQVTGIAKLVFSSKQKFTSITLPDNLSEINSDFNYNRDLKNIYIDGANDTFTSINGILFSKDKKRIIAYPLGKTEKTYNIPDGVKVIGTHAFANNKTMNNVVLPDTLEEIGKSAFSGFENLESIDLPSSLSLLNQGAFEFCHKLKSVTIPENVSSIGNNCFALCYDLEEIYILNPECKINGNGNTICNKMIDDPDGSAKSLYVFDGVIHGYEGSTAQTYADKYGYKFESLGKYDKDISQSTTTGVPTTTSTTTTSTTTSSAITTLTTVPYTTTTSNTTPEPPVTEYALGDINNNGNIDAVDASTVLAYYAMISTNKDGGFDNNQKAAADVDHDGKINAVDASNILSYYAYVSTTKEQVMSMEEFMKKK
ncbi:MAG: leucine-rich repeat protein [Ruminococcus sp.]|nr:leucine-rich repeat protein [Ruminococcus sp.]